MLDEVVIRQYQLTGYVEVDTQLIPVADDGYRYSISGLNAGYESR